MKLFTLFSLIVCMISPCLSLAGEPETEYYALLVDNKKMGSVMAENTEDSDRVYTTETTNMSISRAGVNISMTVIDKSVETIDGKPISFESIQDMGIMKMTTTGRFVADGKVEITKSMMGSSTKSMIDVDPDTLMGHGMMMMQKKKGLKEGTKYSAKLFVPSMMKAVEAHVSIGGKKQVDLFGRLVTLVETKVKMATPGGVVETIGYVDSDMRALKAITPMMGMKIVMIACDKQFALSPDDEIDFLNKMAVKSPAPLKTKGCKVLGKVTYTISPKEDKKLNILSNDNQKLKKLENGKLLLTIDPANATAKSTLPYSEKDNYLLECTKPSSCLQSDNTKIIELAKKAIGSEKNAAKAARKIESFVDNYIIEKNMSVGYATALEVAESKTGDCSEHAVLTAAMCRAVGIPSRVVCGLVYADEFAGMKNIFAGHAWNEVYVGGKWIGLDSTRPFGAGHIALASGNGDPEDFFSMVNTFGYIEIEKIEQ